jgi:hypothetical protein
MLAASASIELFRIAAGMGVGRRHVGEVADFSLHLYGNRFDTSTACPRISGCWIISTNRNPGSNGCYVVECFKIAVEFFVDVIRKRPPAYKNGMRVEPLKKSPAISLLNASHQASVCVGRVLTK